MNRKLVQTASSLVGNPVRNADGEHLGRIEEIVIDLHRGRVAYAVLSFGGFLGIGDKLFAIPWNAMKLDTAHAEYILDVTKETLEEAKGFQEDDWPDFADLEWSTGVHRHYRIQPYWEE